MEKEQKEDFRSKFSLGKIKNKYLIIQIFSFACFKRPSLWFLFKVNCSMRILLLENQLTIKKFFIPQLFNYNPPVQQFWVEFDGFCEYSNPMKVDFYNETHLLNSFFCELNIVAKIKTIYGLQSLLRFQKLKKPRIQTLIVSQEIFQNYMNADMI